MNNRDTILAQITTYVAKGMDREALRLYIKHRNISWESYHQAAVLGRKKAESA